MSSLFIMPNEEEQLQFVLEEEPINLSLTIKDEIDSIDFNINEGGSGGTSDYNELANKPKINGITLVDNQTLEELGADIHFEIPNSEVLRLWNTVGGNN